MGDDTINTISICMYMVSRLDLREINSVFVIKKTLSMMYWPRYGLVAQVGWIGSARMYWLSWNVLIQVECTGSTRMS